MKATIKDTLIFNDGTEIYAHQGLVSINENLDVREGYDGYLIEDSFDGDDELVVLDWDSNCYITFTNEHRIELADYMIDLWTKFKNQK